MRIVSSFTSKLSLEKMPTYCTCIAEVSLLVVDHKLAPHHEHGIHKHFHRIDRLLRESLELRQHNRGKAYRYRNHSESTTWTHCSGSSWGD